KVGAVALPQGWNRPLLARQKRLWQGSPHRLGAARRDSFCSVCCCSSVVEHFIGNEEVDSSILSNSTTTLISLQNFAPCNRHTHLTRVVSARMLALSSTNERRWSSVSFQALSPRCTRTQATITVSASSTATSIKALRGLFVMGSCRLVRALRMA